MDLCELREQRNMSANDEKQLSSEPEQAQVAESNVAGK